MFGSVNTAMLFDSASVMVLSSSFNVQFVNAIFSCCTDRGGYKLKNDKVDSYIESLIAKRPDFFLDGIICSKKIIFPSWKFPAWKQ